MRYGKRIGIVLLALVLSAVSGYTEDEGPEYEGVPAYSVARLKIFEGSAWVRTPDSGDWEEFHTNSPVPVRSLVSIPENSEAELQFHGGQFVLLTEGTELDIRQLDDARSSFRLRSGEIRFYLPEHDFAPVRVSLPADRDAVFAVPGRYWMTLTGDDETTLVVREGMGNVSDGRGEFQVKPGEQAVIGREVRIGRYSGPEEDDFEEPAPLSDAERETGVPPATVHELRQYGEWVHSPDYGYVWRPRVSPDWSPYYFGRWVWISPYGWTWVSYEPWGWYPYHYGYWYTDPVFGWVWYPFRSFVSFSFVFGGHHFHHFHRHAHFVPANVRFVRDGRRVRWVPLRPGERTRRITFTRSDTRLSRWERPLERGTVFVRREGTRDREWRDWTSVRRGRSEVVRTPGATLRQEEGRKGRGGEARPGTSERVIERTPGSGRERPMERRIEADRPGPQRQERQEKQERWRRVVPPSSRPERSGGKETPSVRRTERGERSKSSSEKYGDRTPSRNTRGRGERPAVVSPASPERGTGGSPAGVTRERPARRDTAGQVERTVPRSTGNRGGSRGSFSLPGNGGRGGSSGRGGGRDWSDFGNRGGGGGRFVR